MLGTLVFLGWFATVLYWSERHEASDGEASRLAAVAALEPVVLAVAADGLDQLSMHDQRARLSGAANEPALLALFGAWAKLSLGRAGLLEPTTCARLPWLLLGALSPLLLYRALRARRGALVAGTGAAALGFLWLRAASGSAAWDGSHHLGWLMLVVTPYLATLQRAASTRRRQCSAVLAALTLAIALALSQSALWVAFICALHLPLARWTSARQLACSGRFPLPSFLFLGLPLAAPSLVLLNPQLWQATAVQIAAFVLGPVGASSAVSAQVPTLEGVLHVPGVIAIGALLGVACDAALARTRRATARAGVVPEGPATLLALIAVGLVVTLLLPWAFPPQLAGLRPPREYSLPFWAMGLGLAAGAIRDFARRLRCVAKSQISP